MHLDMVIESNNMIGMVLGNIINDIAPEVRPRQTSRINIEEIIT